MGACSKSEFLSFRSTGTLSHPNIGLRVRIPSARSAGSSDSAPTATRVEVRHAVSTDATGCTCVVHLVNANAAESVWTNATACTAAHATPSDAAPVVNPVHCISDWAMDRRIFSAARTTTSPSQTQCHKLRGLLPLTLCDTRSNVLSC